MAAEKDRFQKAYRSLTPGKQELFTRFFGLSEKDCAEEDSRVSASLRLPDVDSFIAGLEKQMGTPDD